MAEVLAVTEPCVATDLELRAAGFSGHVGARDEMALRLLCAFNGVDPANAPPGWKCHPNESTKAAWQRVANILNDEEQWLRAIIQQMENVMFGFGSIGGGPVALAPQPCKACGALCGADHKKDCPVLGAIRAQEYPEVIDDNGSRWYMNALAKRDREIADLKATIAELRADRG